MDGNLTVSVCWNVNKIPLPCFLYEANFLYGQLLVHACLIQCQLPQPFWVDSAEKYPSLPLDTKTAAFVLRQSRASSTFALCPPLQLGKLSHINKVVILRLNGIKIILYDAPAL